MHRAYEWVQAMKELPWEPPAVLVETVSRVYREQTGREISSAALKVTLDGMGWVTRMAQERGLDMEELMEICETVGDNARANVEQAKLGGVGEDELSIGVGAGFFTGMWLAFKYGDLRR